MKIDNLFMLFFPPITGVAMYLLTEPRTFDTLLSTIIWVVACWFIFAVGKALDNF